MQATKHFLPTGARLITIPQPDSLSTTFLILVEAGSKYESKELSGLSHFLEHMCFKGTTKRPRPLNISSDLDSLGAHYNAFTSQEYTGYYATVEPKMALPALEIVSDIYLNSRFPAEEIEKEKGVIVEEINMYEDMPQRQVQDLLFELMYGDQPAGWNIAGTRETVRSLTRDNFIDYRSKHYVAAGTVIVVAGRFSETQLNRQLHQHLGHIPQTAKAAKLAVIEQQASPRLLLKHKASDQTHLAFGVRAYPVGHPDYAAVEVLASVLGGGMSSRLFTKIREELGAAYYVRSSQEVFTDHGLVLTVVGADNRRVNTIIEAVLEESKRLGRVLMPAAELKRVKQFLVGNLFLSLETSNALAMFYGVQEIWGQKLQSPRALARQLQAVTAADVRRVARDLFSSRHLNLAVVGPVTDEAQFAPSLNF